MGDFRSMAAQTGFGQRFAKRVAAKLKLPYIESLRKLTGTQQQKELENSYLQCTNALKGFEAVKVMEGSDVLLIDDMIDSGWTSAVCGCFLRRQGAGEVYPMALALTKK